jgi:hypothetical protein
MAPRACEYYAPLGGMETSLQVPARIRDVSRWEEHCRKIHARARDLVDGKLTLMQAAEAIHKLAIWTLATDDPDLAVFGKMLRDSVGLPIGSERQYWSKAALEREAPRIQAWEDRWKALALATAHRLIEKYRWALAARRRRRRTGHAV